MTLSDEELVWKELRHSHDLDWCITSYRPVTDCTLKKARAALERILTERDYLREDSFTRRDLDDERFMELEAENIRLRAEQDKLRKLYNDAQDDASREAERRVELERSSALEKEAFRAEHAEAERLRAALAGIQRVLSYVAERGELTLNEDYALSLARTALQAGAASQASAALQENGDGS